MKPARLYLGMAIAGFVIPWLFLFGFIVDESASVVLYEKALALSRDKHGPLIWSACVSLFSRS